LVAAGKGMEKIVNSRSKSDEGGTKDKARKTLILSPLLHHILGTIKHYA